MKDHRGFPYFLLSDFNAGEQYSGGGLLVVCQYTRIYSFFSLFVSLFGLDVVFSGDIWFAPNSNTFPDWEMVSGEFYLRFL